MKGKDYKSFYENIEIDNKFKNEIKHHERKQKRWPFVTGAVIIVVALAIILMLSSIKSPEVITEDVVGVDKVTEDIREYIKEGNQQRIEYSSSNEMHDYLGGPLVYDMRVIQKDDPSQVGTFNNQQGEVKELPVYRNKVYYDCSYSTALMGDPNCERGDAKVKEWLWKDYRISDEKRERILAEVERKLIDAGIDLPIVEHGYPYSYYYPSIGVDMSVDEFGVIGINYYDKSLSGINDFDGMVQLVNTYLNVFYEEEYELGVPVAIPMWESASFVMKPKKSKRPLGMDEVYVEYYNNSFNFTLQRYPVFRNVKTYKVIEYEKALESMLKGEYTHDYMYEYVKQLDPDWKIQEDKIIGSNLEYDYYYRSFYFGRGHKYSVPYYHFVVDVTEETLRNDLWHGPELKDGEIIVADVYMIAVDLDIIK